MQKAENFQTLPRCQVSNDLLWELTRNRSGYLVKRNGLTLSRDPLNLTGLNTKRDSGIANTEALGLSTQVVNRRVIHRKVKKNAPVVKLKLSVKSRRQLPKKRCVPLKCLPETNNLVYSASERLTSRSVAKVKYFIYNNRCCPDH